MYFSRKILKEIEKHLKSRQIIVLTGMRRSGKTTAFRMIYEKINSENKVFLDLENPLDQKIFEEKDYNNIWANLRPYGITPQKKSYVFIDEIQDKPEITKTIKYLYDHYPVKFFLTGSSSFYLKNLFPESLAGRKFIFELYPLDFEEFLMFKRRKKEFKAEFKDKEKAGNSVVCERFKKLYDEYLDYGGFPQVVLEESALLKKSNLSDIFKSYFEKDVRGLADFKNISAFRDLILLLLGRAGAKLDVSKLAKEVGVSRETVYSYLSFLEATYFIKLVQPYSRNVDREVSGARKVYICDNGFISQFSRSSEGSLLENAVWQNIRRRGEIKYYQKRSGPEIDFIVDGKIALEVKQKGGDYDYAKLAALAKSLKIKEYYVVSRKFAEGKGIIPAVEV